MYSRRIISITFQRKVTSGQLSPRWNQYQWICNESTTLYYLGPKFTHRKNIWWQLKIGSHKSWISRGVRTILKPQQKFVLVWNVLIHAKMGWIWSNVRFQDAIIASVIKKIVEKCSKNIKLYIWAKCRITFDENHLKIKDDNNRKLTKNPTFWFESLNSCYEGVW